MPPHRPARNAGPRFPFRLPEDSRTAGARRDAWGCSRAAGLEIACGGSAAKPWGYHAAGRTDARARPPMPPLAKSNPLWHALSRGPRPEVRLSQGKPRSPTARPRAPGRCGSAVSLHRARPHKPPGRREVCETCAARLRVGGRGQHVARGIGAWAAPGARLGKSWGALVQTHVSDRMVCGVLGLRGKGGGTRRPHAAPPPPPASPAEGASHNAQRAPARTSAVQPPTGGRRRTDPRRGPLRPASGAGRPRGGAAAGPAGRGPGRWPGPGPGRGPISSGRARAGGRGQGPQAGRARGRRGPRGWSGAGARAGLTDRRTDRPTQRPRRARSSDPPGRSARPAAAAITGAGPAAAAPALARAPWGHR